MKNLLELQFSPWTSSICALCLVREAMTESSSGLILDPPSVLPLSGSTAFRSCYAGSANSYTKTAFSRKLTLGDWQLVGCLLQSSRRCQFEVVLPQPQGRQLDKFGA